MSIQITSTAFKNGDLIPKKYTCDAENISPELSWSNIPEGTKSLAIICDDPDAPRGGWVHWVIYDIPPTVKNLSEKIPAIKTLSNGIKQGNSDFKTIGYGGPCPPSGTHRYYFRIYALNIETRLEPGLTQFELLKIMKDHIIGEGELMGRYKKGEK